MSHSPSMQNWTGIGKQHWHRTDFVGMKTSDTSDKMVTQYSTNVASGCWLLDASSCKQSKTDFGTFKASKTRELFGRA